jgi:L-rhamnose isomerase/sugar isomerase
MTVGCGQGERYKALEEKLAARGISAVDVVHSLTQLCIETPSWAVGNSGTRYGTFREKGSARTIWDRIDDCAEIQRVLGICKTMAMHISWDVTDDGEYVPVRQYANDKGLQLGTLHPDGFTRQEYIFGSICSPMESARSLSRDHYKDCVRIAKQLGIKAIGMWVPDGTNYAGQDDIIERRHRLFDGLKVLYNELDDDMVMFLEYKPFEPFFYMTDVCDWGVSLLNCMKLGDKAKVLVDLGHHLSGVNIEQIVATLMDEGKLGAFHFNNRKNADDDLIVASVNPLELFLILNEIVAGQKKDPAREVAYMLDQSHNIEPSIEGIIYSVMNVHRIHAKALIVDREKLREAQGNFDVIGAHDVLMDAFDTDVGPLLAAARERMGLSDPDPLRNYRNGGYAKKICLERQFSGNNTLGG